MLHETVPHEEQEVADKPGWVLKELRPWHELVCSLLAQGMSGRDIAAVADCTPNYIYMLARQDLIKKRVMDIAAFAGLQLEAQFSKSVEAIGEALQTGNNKERLMAARLQMEATGRVGSRHAAEDGKKDMNDELVKLSSRLVGLLEHQRMANEQSIVEGEYEDADISGGQVPAGSEGQPALQSAQGNGNGLRYEGGEVSDLHQDGSCEAGA